MGESRRVSDLRPRVAVQCEARDLLLVAVRHVHRPVGNRDAALPADVQDARAELPDERAIGSELLHPVVVGIEHIDVARGVERDAADRAELTWPGPVLPELAEKRPAGAEVLDHIAPAVAHVHVAGRRHRHGLRLPEHSPAVLADRCIRAVRARLGAGARRRPRRGGERQQQQRKDQKPHRLTLAPP